MLNFDEREEIKMEQEAFSIETELQAIKDRRNQAVIMTASEFAKAAQHMALLMVLRSAASGERYDIEKVAVHVVAVFNELEGAGC